MTRVLAIACAALALSAGIAGRGWLSAREQAAKAEAAYQGASMQIAAAFADEMAKVKAESASLASRLKALQRAGAVPVAVFSGTSAVGHVPGPAPRPAPSGALPAPTPPPSAAPASCSSCVLAAGDPFAFRLVGAEVHRADGGGMVVATVSLLAGDPLVPLIGAAVDAPVTLPPQNPVRVEVQRARWALRGGVVEPWGELGGYVGAGLRVAGPAWVEVEGRRFGGDTTAALGLRWEW